MTQAAYLGFMPQPKSSIRATIMSRKTSRDKNGNQPLLADVFPTIAHWASGYGWVEFGIDGLDRPFVRALDEGGTVWEESGLGTLDEALGDLEKGLVPLVQNQKTKGKPSSRKTTKRKPEQQSKPRDGKPEPKHRAKVDPVVKKIEKLEEIALALREGEHFSVTRLTTIKGLCQNATDAGAFALFLARKVQRRMKEKQAPQRYRTLVNRAVREMKPYLDDTTEERRQRLWSLLREIEGEQNEHENIRWGAVRIIKSMDLLVVEHAMRAVLRPSEAAFWLYYAARDYTGDTDRLPPSSAPMVEEFARFWRRHHRL